MEGTSHLSGPDLSGRDHRPHSYMEVGEVTWVKALPDFLVLRAQLDLHKDDREPGCPLADCDFG